MEHIFIQIMSEMTELTKEEKKDITLTFPIKIFKKGSVLLKQGNVAKDAYYVVKGCIRAYELVHGDEITTAFLTEGQCAANFQSLSNNEPSKYSYECLEETTATVSNSAKEIAFYKKHPRFEAFCISGMEKMMGEKQEELTSFMTMKPEQRYMHLLKTRPGLIQRVPQHQLASFIGIKPQSLSRIRSRILEKEKMA
ncbi:cyclic nucleotide-binding protein [Maribacter sp. 4U21]|uniref:Crp/Fnr family transcriptional regulator n=1 Tax=Maribacter sp. 4U21 TaxID=1889779 RepID=UPI000C1591F6|nr:Crp/Fnr family transcriptional regulator [Maribacter sp. 4U21]PIB30703.1 cyclic nucleotide-binding protein [Maribacter sp. 4U21]